MWWFGFIRVRKARVAVGFVGKVADFFFVFSFSLWANGTILHVPSLPLQLCRFELIWHARARAHTHTHTKTKNVSKMTWHLTAKTN